MKALDCCAGAGGLSLGLQRAGFDVLGVELDANAACTHVENVGPCDIASLWDYSPRGMYELVAGGIPCQSHSTAGKREGTNDPRGQLYVPFLRIAREAQARAVLIENVRGMLSSPSPTHGTALLEVVAAVRAAGFEHRLHAVDLAAEGDRLHVHLVGERRLVERFLIQEFGTVDRGHDPPLGAGQPERLSTLVDAPAAALEAGGEMGVLPGKALRPASNQNGRRS